MLEALSRPELADLVSPPPHVDTAGLRAEAAAIRAQPRRDGRRPGARAGQPRSQMLAATERGNARLAEIGAELAKAAGKGALAPFTRGQAAGDVWDGLDLSRRREVIRALTTVTCTRPGAAPAPTTWRPRCGMPAGCEPGRVN